MPMVLKILAWVSLRLKWRSSRKLLFFTANLNVVDTDNAVDDTKGRTCVRVCWTYGINACTLRNQFHYTVLCITRNLEAYDVEAFSVRCVHLIIVGNTPNNLQERQYLKQQITFS